MAVVMSGSFGFLLDMYQKVHRNVDLATTKMNKPMARVTLDRGGYTLDETTGAQRRPVFVSQDLTDPNNPSYRILDYQLQPLSGYRVDDRGNVLFKPATVAGNLVWHPDTAFPFKPDEQVTFGRTFFLDTVQPTPGSTERGGTITINLPNPSDSARIFVNGTFVREVSAGVNSVPVLSEMLKAGENTISVQANREDSAFTGQIAITAVLGGLDGLGRGYGGVTFDTSALELEQWSVSRISPNGLAGHIEFELLEGGTMAQAAEDVNRMQAVLATLSNMLGATAANEQTKLQVIR